MAVNRSVRILWSKLKESEQLGLMKTCVTKQYNLSTLRQKDTVTSLVKES